MSGLEPLETLASMLGTARDVVERLRKVLSEWYAATGRTVAVKVSARNGTVTIRVVTKAVLTEVAHLYELLRKAGLEFTMYHTVKTPGADEETYLELTVRAAPSRRE